MLCLYIIWRVFKKRQNTGHMKKIAAHFLKSASINTAVKSSNVETTWKQLSVSSDPAVCSHCNWLIFFSPALFFFFLAGSWEEGGLLNGKQPRLHSKLKM